MFKSGAGKGKKRKSSFEAGGGAGGGGGFGFSTALEFMNDENNNDSNNSNNNNSIADAARNDNGGIEGEDEDYYHDTNAPRKNHHPEEASFLPSQHAKQEQQQPKVESIEPNQTSFEVNLTVRGIQFYKDEQQSSSSLDQNSNNIILERQPNNEYDANAIAVYRSSSSDDENANNQASAAAAASSKKIIGHIAKEQAALLSPLLDANTIQLDNNSTVLQEEYEKSLWIIVNVQLLDASKFDEFNVLYNNMMNSTDIAGYNNRVAKAKTTRERRKKMGTIIDEDAVEEYAFGITKQDEETAATCSIDICKLPSLPWKMKNNNKASQQQEDCYWPPSPNILKKLGVGDANDTVWWQTNGGLKPPSQWNVTGAIDLLPVMSISADQKRRASDVLDDAVHGVTNVWTDETLDEMRHLMHSEKFWSHRGADAFIRSFGGPYVLGQNEGKLKLIKGSPHTPLTEKICRGHNLVYEMIHFEKPPSPGFNTIIFGLNLRRSGFHYHQDTIGSLHAKNEPMVGHQPVVTTVYYQKPSVDNGKELVLWKPLFNFKPRNRDSLYNAARGIQTYHGMIHVQKAGLQGHAQHGIFHTPIFTQEQHHNSYSSDEDDDDDETPAVISDPREGYRVAITARITYPNSEKRLDPFVKNGHYQKLIGPDGFSTLRLSD